jgi:hypothetical protein
MENAINFHITLRAVYDKAIQLYKAGNMDSSTYFDAAEAGFLADIGHSAQEVFDFAEDAVKYGEPDFETFLLLASARAHYFRFYMNSTPSEAVVDTGDLPPKTEAVDGIEWLPRLIEKARAKLRGEMSDDLMYGCGGDRKFFKSHDIHPVTFLALVASRGEDTQAIIDWVRQNSKA